MTNENNAYDGYTPSKVTDNRDQRPDQSGLPGSKHAQWENLARTHAEIESEYYSLRATIKRHLSPEFGMRAVAGCSLLLVVFIIFTIAT